MVRLLLPVRLLVVLALAGGGAMATRQAALIRVLPPSVAQALETIQDKQAEVMAGFG